MTSKKASVLVVDDDVRMLRMMKRTLELEGYQVFSANSGEAALSIFDEETPNLVLLDILMPGMDGYTVCQYIRDFSQIPIIMVTAKDSDNEKVEGLDFGADDYITKPFSASEFMARVRAVLRRTKLDVKTTQPAFHSSSLVIDFIRRRVTVANREINLTAIEYRLLSYLARSAGCLTTHDVLLENIWGEDYIGKYHLLQVNMARLRQKLRDNARKSTYILTRPGMGYMMVKQR